ncbi:thiamine-phosphate kinase [Parenemella sanctibonifatiensis]|uniref:Thiamine-monophosphate kinase n=1 Tax=Parenemella sanctibonifatiensis TaxID=2016505 RepID=A0A255EFQ1_9ACTN|nr:thiamine-phosphate kinase [Parenemella sanctibonifatiensis]OYN90090.1 thiamine-phosphate kinase [Parenemella sanctibonifatiensis]
MAADQTLDQISEFELIEAITAGLPQADPVRLGPGDDAAVVDLQQAVVSTDIVVENVHFRRTWSTADDVGRKAAAVNIADLEAMGATPRALVVALTLPTTLKVSWVLELMAGIQREAAEAGVSVVGGDLSSGEQIVVAVTALGDLEGRLPLTRSGAHAGDVVAIRGRLGWAAAGLVVLGRGFRSPRAVVEAQRVPQVPYGAGRQAAMAGATAMVDISDGLIADLGHIARASGVRIDVRTEQLQVPDPLQAVAAATGSDPYRLVLTGGEDHAMAATFAADLVPSDWTVIGSVTEGEAGVSVDGADWDEPAGHDHFHQRS